MGPEWNQAAQMPQIPMGSLEPSSVFQKPDFILSLEQIYWFLVSYNIYFPNGKKLSVHLEI